MLANNRDIYERIIKPDIFKNKTSNPNQESLAIYLAGQPGSGKSSLRDEILAQRNLENSTIVLNTDNFREYHPDYITLLSDKHKYAQAPILVNEDASAWFKLAEADAKEKGLNILYDTTMGANSMNSFIEGISKNKSVGYNSEIHVLAVNEKVSKLGIYARYENENLRLGYGRMVTVSSHDNNYSNLPSNLKNLANNPNLIDRMTVYEKTLVRNENGILLNGKENRVFDSKDSEKYNLGIRTLLAIREKPLSDQQKEYFSNVLENTEKLILARRGDIANFKKDMSNLNIELGRENKMIIELSR
jgi:predicted ABC-type ATPase